MAGNGDGEDDESEKPESDERNKFEKEKNDLKDIDIDDDENSYKKKRNSLRTMKFKQYKKKIERFLKIFRFKIRTRHLFRLIKHCYRFRRMPKNHNEVINKILKKYTKIKKMKKIKSLYKKFNKEINPRSPKDIPEDDENQPQSDKEDDDSQPQNVKPSKRKTKDAKKNNKPGKTKKKGKNGEDDESEKPESDERNKFENEKNDLKDIDIDDDENSYKKKRNSLRTMKFKQYKKKIERFLKIFRFKIRTRHLFRLIKHCYRFRRMPKNHNEVINKILKKYTKIKKMKKIKSLYKKFNKEINPRSPKDIPEDDENQPQSDEEEDDSLSPNENPSKEKPKNTKKNVKNKPSKPKKMAGNGEREDDESENQPQSEEEDDDGQSHNENPSKEKPKNTKKNDKNKPCKPKKRRKNGDGEDDESENQPQSEEEDEGESQNENPSKEKPKSRKKNDKNKPGKLGKKRKNGEEEDDESENENPENDGKNKENLPSKNLPKNKSGGMNDENIVRDDDESINYQVTIDLEENFRLEKNELKSINIFDDEDSYELKRDLLRTMTFKQYQSKRYLKRIFKFRIRSRLLFNFIKYLYRCQRIPRNHNKVINKVLKMYSKIRKRNEIIKLYKIYDRQIKPSSHRNVPNEDDYQPKTNEEDESQVPYKMPRKGIPKDKGSEGRDKPRKPKDVGKIKQDEPEDMTNDLVGGRNMPDNRKRKDSQALNIKDSEQTYLRKHLFLKYLTFKKFSIQRNVEEFFKLFGFRVRRKLVFKFIKYCYRSKRMPKNHNRILKKLLSRLRILRPSTQRKFFHYFLKKYDEGVNLYSNEGLRYSAVSTENENSDKLNEGGKNYQNLPEEDVKDGKDFKKDRDDSDVEHFFGNNEEIKLGKNNRDTKANTPQTASKTNDINRNYFNGQLGSGYYAKKNIYRLNENNNNKNNYLETQKSENYEVNTMNSKKQYDENLSRPQFNMDYNNVNPQTDSMSTDINQQPSFTQSESIYDYKNYYANNLETSSMISSMDQNQYDPNFNIPDTKENDKPIPFDTNNNDNNLQNQDINNDEMNSVTEISNQQNYEIQSESENDMRYVNMNPQVDSMFTSMNQQPSFAPSGLRDNSQNYYANDFNANPMIRSMDEERYNNQNNNFLNVMNSDVQYGSQNTMQDDTIDNPPQDNTPYTYTNQEQSGSSMTASSYNTQNDNTQNDYVQNDYVQNDYVQNDYVQNDYVQNDSFSYEQNSQNDMGQTEDDFLNENQEYYYEY